MLPPRRYVILGLLFTCLVTVLWIASFRFDSDDGPKLRGSVLGPIGGGAARTAISSFKGDNKDELGLGPGKAIAGKLGNETAKWVSYERVA